MGLAETAHLVTQLDLVDEMTPGMARAGAEVKAFGHEAQVATAHGGRFTGMMHGAGHAVTHFKERMHEMGKLVGAGLLFGGGFALFEIAKEATSAATEWGRLTDRIKQLTGASTQAASSLSNVFTMFGITGDKQVQTIGMLQKNLGNIENATDGAKKIAKQYGFQIEDNNGKVKSAQRILTDFTDYFNRKNIPASEKAALGAKLFGRSWQNLLPLLQQGGKAVREAFKDAPSMTEDQLRTTKELRKAQREWNEELHTTMQQVGLVMLPLITDVLHSLTDYVKTHKQDIVDFFKGVVQGVRNLGGFIANDILPPIKSLVDAAMGFWNSIPGPFKDMIVKGLVADRTIKFLFGFSPVGLAASIGKDVIGGALRSIMGNFLGRGSSPANPMYVTGMGMGAGMGGATGGMGMLGKLGLGAMVVGDLVAIYEAVDSQILQPVAQKQTELMKEAMGIVGEGRGKAIDDITNMTRQLHDVQGFDRVTIDTTSAKEYSTALANAADEIMKGSTAGTRNLDIQKLQAAQQQAIEHGWTEAANHIGEDIKNLQQGITGALDKTRVKTAQELRQEATKRQRENGTTFREEFDAMRKEMHGMSRQQAHQFALAQRSGSKIQDVFSHLAGLTNHMRTENKYNLAHAARLMMRGFEEGGDKGAKHVAQAIHILKEAQKKAIADGDTRLAKRLGSDIHILEHRTIGKLNAANTTLHTIAQKPPPVVNVTTNVTSQIGVSDFERAQTQINHYGRAIAY